MKYSFLSWQTLVVLLCCNTSLVAQKILWEKSVGGKHSEHLLDAIPTADYGFILAGSSLSSKSGSIAGTNQGDLDYWIWKMDEQGGMVWQKSFGGDGMDLLQKVKATPDGGWILAGTTTSKKSGDKTQEGFGLEDIWIIKLDATGNQEWQQTYGGVGQDYLKTIVPTTDGYLIGATSSSDAVKDANGKAENSFGNVDYWILKINSKGKIQWQKTFGGVYADHLTEILPNAEGYLVAGYSNSPDNGNKSQKQRGMSDYWLIQLNEEGNPLWQKVIGGDKEDQLKSVVKTKDLGFLLLGNSDSGSSFDKTASNQKETDFWLVKIDAEANILWQENLAFTFRDVAVSVSESQDGTILLSGYGLPSKSQSKGEGVHDYLLCKLKPNGEEMWRRVIGSNGQEKLVKTIETRDGGYVLAGTSNGSASRNKQSQSQANDFWIVKLLDEQKDKTPKIPLEAFPNPTHEFTNIIINYDYKKGTISIFDINGRLVGSKEIDGSKTVPVSLQNVPQGIYIIDVQTDIQTDGIKIIKN